MLYEFSKPLHFVAYCTLLCCRSYTLASVTDSDEWFSTICKHGGRPLFTSAVESADQFDKCHCSDFWEGSYCDYIRCFNGTRVQRERCRCKNGTFGRHCLTSAFCKDRGKLVVGLQGNEERVACLCNNGFTGNRCQLPLCHPGHHLVNDSCVCIDNHDCHVEIPERTVIQNPFSWRRHSTNLNPLSILLVLLVSLFPVVIVICAGIVVAVRAMRLERSDPTDDLSDHVTLLGREETDEEQGTFSQKSSNNNADQQPLGIVIDMDYYRAPGVETNEDFGVELLCTPVAGDSGCDRGVDGKEIMENTAGDVLRVISYRSEML